MSKHHIPQDKVDSPGLNGVNYLLKNYYHQDVWEDNRTHEEIWNDFISNEHPDAVDDLKAGVEILFTWSPDKVHEYIQAENTGGLFQENPSASIKWLNDLYQYLLAKNMKNL